MNLNIKFLIVCYIVSAFVDWVFQSEWQASHKSNWTKGNRIDAFDAVLKHSLIYSGLTLFFTMIILGLMGYGMDLKPEHVWIIGITLFITHMIIDTRVPVKLIMRAKGLTKDKIADVQKTGFLQVGIDQRLHEFVILVLAIFIR